MTTSSPTSRRGDLAVLDHEQCIELLRAHHVGRIGLSMAALPVVMPVNYTLDTDRIVMCSEPGTKLDAARGGIVACLEIDDFDIFDHAGWSVLVTGVLTELTDPAEIELAQQLPLTRWLPMTDPHFLALSTELVSGRSIRI